MNGSLDELLQDVAGGLDDAAAGMWRRDVADVVRRAHDMDPEAVDGQMLARAEGYASVLPLDGHGRPGRGAPDPRMEEFLADVRGHVEDHVAARRLRGLPPLRRAGAGIGPWIAGLGVAAVAAGVLVLGPFPLGRAGHRMAEQAASQALRGQAPRDGDRTRSMSGPAPSAPLERVVPGQAAPVEPEDAAAKADVSGAEGGAGGSSGAKAPVDLPVAPTAPPRADARERGASSVRGGEDGRGGPSLSELDVAAAAAWEAGDLGEAERLYRELVRVGGRDALVDLAYGDLFTLAERRHAPSELRRLWRAYLRRFPRGRFAEDARAGLCRASDGAKAARCWRDYLDAFPHGAHVKRARAALEEP